METKNIVMPMFPLNKEFPRECIESSNGIYVKDINGKKYLDTISGLWNVSFGYNDENIKEAIVGQLNKIPYSNLYVAPAKITYQYACKLLEKLNGDFQKLMYTCSGSESSELAMKICRKYQRLAGNRRYNIGAINYSYHGTSYGAMSLSGIDKKLVKDYYPLVDGIKWINIETVQSESERCEIIEEFFEKYKNDLAGIILELVIGSGGVIEIGHKVLKLIRQKCNQYDIVLIFDEVATGFGRTGKMFAYQHYSIVPDLMCISKTMSNGMVPIGGVLLGNKVANFYGNKGGFIEHFSTQNGNPLGCAASMSVLDYMTDELFEEIEKKGKYLEEGLNKCVKPNNSSMEIRRKGLMIALDIKTNSGETLSEEFLDSLLQKAYKKGIIIHPFYNPEKNSGVMLFPAFITEYYELDIIIEKVSKVLNKLV